MTRLPLSILLLGLAGCAAGCAADYSLAGLPDTGDLPPDLGEGPLRVLVTPTDAIDADGSARVLPTLLGNPDLERPLAIDLVRPYRLTGTLTVGLPTPSYRAEVPSTDGAYSGRLFLRTPGLPGQVRAATETDGAFAVDVIEGAYTVTLVPDDPMAPMGSFALDVVEGLVLDQHVQAGLPLYGQVTLAGSPLAGAQVHVETPEGVQGPVATTDADGWYQLNVQPGTWVLRTDGSGDGFDPVLTAPPVAVSTQAVRRDFAYPPRVLHDLAVRVLGPNGQAASGLDFRLRASTLDAFADGAAAEILGNADSRGNIVSRAATGTWVLDLLPGRDDPWTAVRVGPFEIGADVTLPDVTLEPLTLLEGTVIDAVGNGVGGVQVACTEVGFRNRTWSTFTTELGRFELDTTQGSQSCAATPPPGRPDLALTRATTTPSDDRFVLPLATGTPVEGIVTTEGEPEPFALVEIQDLSGRVWASALTDDRGEFAMRLAPADAR